MAQHPLDPNHDSTVELHAGELRLVLAPAVGGAIAEFSSRRGGVVQHWLRPASAEALAARRGLGMASFPLVPWCNRIRDGTSDFGARAVRLRPNMPDSPHTLHGVAWQQPWSVGAVEPAHATLAFSHAPRSATDWPYRFEAEQHFGLDASAGLTVELAIVNLDDVPMPIGIGHHPYVPRRADTRLSVDVDAMWESDADVLPTRLVRPPLLAALRQGVALQGLDLDNNFTGWSRCARVDWPDTGTALELTAEAPLDHFVIFCPPGFDHFCIEPVSNCTDWMNLAQLGPAQVGGQLLAPGERLRARFALQPHWPA